MSPLPPTTRSVIVGRLVINTNTTSDDTCDLWVNPDPATFGAANPPTPSVANANGKADSNVDRFSWRGITTGQQHDVDELRLGFTWAAVTPPTPVALAIKGSGTNSVVSWPTNAIGWNLVGTTNLVGGVWTTNTPIVVQGANNTFTTNDVAGQQFFRLKR